MRYIPGQIVPDSGIYTEFNAANVRVDQVTNIKGHVFPPTLAKGNYYVIFERAKHRSLEK